MHRLISNLISIYNIICHDSTVTINYLHTLNVFDICALIHSNRISRLINIQTHLYVVHINWCGLSIIFRWSGCHVNSNNNNSTHIELNNFFCRCFRYRIMIVHYKAKQLHIIYWHSRGRCRFCADNNVWWLIITWNCNRIIQLNSTNVGHSFLRLCLITSFNCRRIKLPFLPQ